MTATLTAPTDTPTLPRTGAPDKAELLAALEAFVRQRPGVDPGNYGDGREGYLAYRRELADIVKDRQDALTMLAAVERSGVTADEMLAELNGRGRLEWLPMYREIDFTTCQYFPTEYRRAVCRFAASVLWTYWRDNGCDTREKIQAEAKRTFRSRRIWQYFR